MKQPLRWSAESSAPGNDFAAIGFPDPEEDLEFYNRFFEAYRESASSIAAVDGRYLVWQLPNGPELCITLDAAGEVCELRPHFRGSVRRDVAILERVQTQPENPWAGYFRCVSNPADDDLEDGDPPLLVEIPAFRLYDHLALPLRSHLSLTAFALRLEFYLNGSAFEEDQPVLGHTPEGIPGFARAPIKLNSQFFFPLGTMPSEGADESAVAEFAGEIQHAEYHRNPVSDRWFWTLRVATHGGEIDVVADPMIVPQDPAPMQGNVVRGVYWLSGRPYAM